MRLRADGRAFRAEQIKWLFVANYYVDHGTNRSR